MKKNKILLLVQSLLCVACACLLSVLTLNIYLKGSAVKAKDPLAWIFTREQAVTALKTAAPLVIAAVIVTIVCVILGIRDEKGLKPVKGGRIPVQGTENKKRMRSVRVVCLIAAAALIIGGVVNGSAGDVLAKAVNICTECVGLG